VIQGEHHAIKTRLLIQEEDFETQKWQTMELK